MVATSSETGPKTGRAWRWIKRGLRALIVLVLLGVLGRVGLPFVMPVVLDSVAGSFGFSASYDEMHLRVFRGDLEIWGLRVGPAHEGEQAPPNFLTLDYLSVDLDVESLFDEKPRVRRAVADGLELRLDRDEAGTWALLETIAPLLEGGGEPDDEPVLSTDSEPASLSSPIEVSALRLNDAKILLSDKALDPPLERQLNLGLRISDVGSSERETTIQAQAWSSGVLDGARTWGTALTGGEHLALELDMEVSGLELKELEVYFAELGVRPIAEDTDIFGELHLLVERPEPASSEVSVSFNLSGLRFEVEGREEFATDSVSLSIPALGTGGLKLELLEIDGVRGRAARNADGLLQVGGFELGGVTSADPVAVLAEDATPSASEEPQPSQDEEQVLTASEEAESTDPDAHEDPFAVELSRVTCRDFAFDFDDAGVSPGTTLGVRLEEFRLTNLVLASDEPEKRASLFARGQLPGMIDELVLEGSAQASLSSFDLATVFSAQGIRLDAINPYLAGSGIDSLYDGGSCKAQIVASGALEAGGTRLSFGANDVQLFDGLEAEPRFEVATAALRDMRINPASGEYSLAGGTLDGLRVRVERAPDRSLHLLGFGLGAPAESDAGGSEGSNRSRVQASSQSREASPQQTASSIPARIELADLSWSNTYIEFIDLARDEPFKQVFDDVDARLTGLVLGGDGARSPAQLELHGSAGELAESIDLKGEFATTPGKLDFTSELALEATGLSLRALQPYLDDLQFEPELDHGELSMSLRAELTEEEGVISADFGMADLHFSEGQRTIASLDSAGVTGLSYTEQELRVKRILAAAPRVAATLDEEGALHLMGVRVLPRVPEGGGAARLPRLHELIDLRAISTLISSIAIGDGPAVRLDELKLEAVAFDWKDLTVTPPIDAHLKVDAGVRSFVLGRAADPAEFDINLHVDDALEGLRISGDFMPAPLHFSTKARVEGHGLRSGVFSGYVPAGIDVHLSDGRLEASIEAEAAEYEPGEYRASLTVSDVDYREAGADEPYFAVASLGGELLRYSENENLLEMGDLHLRGLELELIRESEDLVSALGVRLDLGAIAERNRVAAAKAAEEAASEPPLSITDRAGTAEAVEQRRVFPRISIDGLELELGRLAFIDHLRDDLEPLELSLSLANPDLLVLLDANPEELEPLKLHFGGSFPPLIDEVDLDILAEPYIAEPRFRADARLSGIDGASWIDLIPELGEDIDGSQLTNGEFTGGADFVLRARRRGPTDYDLRKGFGFGFEASELAFRNEPGGDLLLGLGGLRVDARRIRPLTGDVHISEVEILEPRGTATRVEDGLRIAGVVLKLAEVSEVPQEGEALPAGDATVEEAPAGPVAQSDSSQLGTSNLPDLRIDRFFVTGMDFTIRDEVVVPPMHLPLEDFDLEVRGLSVRGIEQGRPVRISTIATAGTVMLPKRDAYGRLVGLPDGEESTWPVGNYATEQRLAFEDFSFRGELSVHPQLKGWAKLDLRGLDLLNYSGNSQELGVVLENGMLDSTISMKLNRRGLTVDGVTTFTWLEMSERKGGPISSLLSLPAPLDTVIFMTRNGQGENSIPISFHIPTSGVSYSNLVATATATVAQVLASSVARSPFRLVGGILDFTGLTSEEPVARAQESLDFYFEPGAPRGQEGDRAKLDALLEMMREDPKLTLVVQHELGADDVTRCEELANPDPRWCREFAVGLRLEKARLWKERERLAEDVRAEYTMGEIDRAESIAIRLRALDAELGRVEDSLDDIYQLLRPGAERRKDKRTKQACLELGRLRLSVARARLISELGPEVADRLDIRRPRFAPITAEGAGGGLVVVTPRKR